MSRTFGLRRKSVTPQAKAIDKLDRAVSILVRDHYQTLGCFTCGRMVEVKESDCGHFRRRELKNTRFLLSNLGLQCRRCNRFDGGRAYEFSKKIDELWGKGTADRVDKLSRKTKNWDVIDLETLYDAARKGWPVYLQMYDYLTK